MMKNLPAHSPLGASSAERWMNCPGSSSLLKLLKLAESDEPDYRRDGTLAHAQAALCLVEDQDGWEAIDAMREGGMAEEDLAQAADAIQLYLDTVRPIMKVADYFEIEEKMYRPDLHPLYFGTADFHAYIEREELLDLTDYKHGVGIAVDAESNVQLMYYAFGLLNRYPSCRRVRLRIVQPRAFHPLGPIREWEITAEDLAHWAETELLPKMREHEMNKELDAGPWCRFCPAKLVCPLLTGLFGAACKADPKEIINISDEALGRHYQLLQGVKFYTAALEKETLARLMASKNIAGTKLVAKKANRVWKPEAKTIIPARLGEAAFEPAEMKSPAAIEKLGGDAKALVAEWAYAPFNGLTVALYGDKRAAVNVQSLEERFRNAKLED